jgi:flagellar hook-length control protein FliK
MANEMNIANPSGFGAGHKNAAAAAKALKASGLSRDNGTQNALSGDIGALESRDSGVTLFQKIYNAIAQSNKIAQSKNGAKNGTESDKTDQGGVVQDASLQSLAGSELVKLLGISQGAQNGADLQQILAEGTGQASSSDLSVQAAALIREAIATITKTLNLKVQDGLENLGTITPSKAVISQLAEMLSTLKGIAGVLDESVTMNQPLECKNLAFDVSTAASVQQTIREQVFKIELALKMMGISKDVAAVMAQKDSTVQDVAATLSGIPQASDPSKLAMPSIHARQVLGELFTAKEQKVETLLTKLAQTLKQSGTSEAETSALVTKIAQVAQGAVTAQKVKASDIKEIGPLDSQVMRKILKVDAAQATAVENKTAAQQNVTLGLPKEGLVLTSKTIAEATAAVQKTEDTGNLTVIAGQNAASLASDRLMSTLRAAEPGTMRQLEESVMTQVAEKLNVAIKTGITEIRVMLRPESLGDVQLKIKVDGDVVTGKMYVESQQVKHIVEANLQTLKDSLSQHNLSVGSFTVDLNQGNGAQDQARDLAFMNANGQGTGAGNKEKSSNDMENKENTAEGTIVSGVETGRKFGTNTIEYFA